MRKTKRFKTRAEWAQFARFSMKGNLTRMSTVTQNLLNDGYILFGEKALLRTIENCLSNLLRDHDTYTEAAIKNARR